MNYLLDTNILLWATANPERLSKKARQIIENPKNHLYCSMASFWEIAIKNSLGKDDFAVDLSTLEGELSALEIEELPITLQDCKRVQALPFVHRDPFDRMIIAQAMQRELRILSADAKIGLYRRVLVVSKSHTY